MSLPPILTVIPVHAFQVENSCEVSRHDKKTHLSRRLAQSVLTARLRRPRAKIAYRLRKCATTACSNLWVTSRLSYLSRHFRSKIVAMT